MPNRLLQYLKDHGLCRETEIAHDLGIREALVRAMLAEVGAEGLSERKPSRRQTTSPSCPEVYVKWDPTSMFRRSVEHALHSCTDTLHLEIQCHRKIICEVLQGVPIFILCHPFGSFTGRTRKAPVAGERRQAVERSHLRTLPGWPIGCGLAHGSPGLGDKPASAGRGDDRVAQHRDDAVERALGRHQGRRDADRVADRRIGPAGPDAGQ